METLSGQFLQGKQGPSLQSLLLNTQNVLSLSWSYDVFFTLWLLVNRSGISQPCPTYSLSRCVHVRMWGNCWRGHKWPRILQHGPTCSFSCRVCKRWEETGIKVTNEQSYHNTVPHINCHAVSVSRCEETGVEVRDGLLGVVFLDHLLDSLSSSDVRRGIPTKREKIVCLMKMVKVLLIKGVATGEGGGGGTNYQCPQKKARPTPPPSPSGKILATPL